MRRGTERQPPMLILLAEDNEANRILVRSLLEREGHVLDFAENGLVALMRCESKKYDLILMDILMPVMDGVKALRKLRRSDSQNAQTPVFALTGYSSQPDKRRYRQAGFDLVLTKPLRPNDLTQAWNNYLKGNLNISPITCEEPLQNFEEISFIDDEVIGQLLISGTPNDIRLIAEKFWMSTRSMISVIHENLALAMRGRNEALSSLRQAAHGIKGSAANIGLQRLSRIAATLQNAPPDKVGALVLCLSETIAPSADLLEQRIAGEGQIVNTGSLAVHFGDVNARTAPNQNPPSPLESQSRHKISTEGALRRQAQVP